MIEITSIDMFYKTLVDYGLYKDHNNANIKQMNSNLLTDVFFRGQSAKYNSIISSLSRDTNFIYNEFNMYHETLEQKGVVDFHGFNLPIEYLSKMQHYSMPTRLIDFTVNPLIALYFATENISPDSDGIVYVYKRRGHEIDNKAVKLLSLIPTIDGVNITKLQAEFEKTFKAKISHEYIKSNINKCIFIEFTEKLKESNPRLFQQYGTFAICGNEIRDDDILPEISAIDISAADIAIRITSEFKASIQKELDENFTINKSIVYPELSSWAEYIKSKYCRKNFIIDGTFSIMSDDDISVSEVKRLSIKLLLARQLNSEQIKEIVLSVASHRQKEYRIIWIKVARNSDDYIANNWITEAIWVSNELDIKYYPIPKGELDPDNFYWKNISSTTETNRYFQSNVYKNDRNLFVGYHYVYRTMFGCFNQLQIAYEYMDDEEFDIEIKKRQYGINQASKKINEFGRSRDNDFDAYLSNYINFILYLEDITIATNINVNWASWRIERCFSSLRNCINRIEHDKKKWMKLLNIENQDLLDDGDNDNIKIPEYYFQTIPISVDAIEIFFKPQYYLKNNNLVISGSTNLYDYAELLMTLRVKHGDTIFQNAIVVMNGRFKFEINKQILQYRSYTLKLSVSYPRTQNQNFINNAGCEYENISGEYILHSGINSTINYQEDIEFSDISKPKC